jgi:hypothetical protein
MCSIVVGMALLGDFTFKRCGSKWGRLADGYQIRTFATTTTLAVNTTPSLTTTGIRGPYDWTLPNIVDDDGALRSAFLAKTVRLIILP